MPAHHGAGAHSLALDAWEQAFEREFDNYSEAVRDALLVRTGLLVINGVPLGRLHAGTQKGCRHANI